MIAKYRDPFDETLLVDDAGCNRLSIAVNQSVDAESQTRAEKGSRRLFSFLTRNNVRNTYSAASPGKTPTPLHFAWNLWRKTEILVCSTLREPT